ncbi:UDP-N-acetylmuramoyl-L-alanine--D-glutamate ligase [Candidatus Kapabacteria bacterium]|nr:UDP-N-acetylmuramoyl-L-alanine--D-glutamate ligase [Candidatus Kapabacteria bacterium]
MKITILGAGRAGTAAAILAKNKGHEVFVSESNTNDNPNYLLLEKHDIEFEKGTHSIDRIMSSDLIIPSPGIKPDNKILIEAINNNIKIIDETAFALRYLSDNPVIAVTGTNGKTTTVKLIHHLFKSAGKKSHLAGNVGVPLSNLVAEIKPNDVIILELSSYQLERSERINPKVSIFLNISEDHLDWHGNFVNYFASKWKITESQSEDNLLVLTLDNDTLIKNAFSEGHRTRANLSAITQKPLRNLGDNFSSGVFVENGKIFFFKQQGDKPIIKEELMPISELAIPGAHNLYNSMAAAIAARRFEIPNEDIRDALTSFNGVEHRLEFVRSFQNIDFINDSKATNINSAWYALSSYNKPIVWIAGGTDSENDYSSLDDLVKNNVKTVVSMGEDKDNIFNHFSSICNCKRAENLNEALVNAVESAISGDVILFSPACKSFDQYTNFEERGQDFKKIVNSL